MSQAKLNTKLLLKLAKDFEQAGHTEEAEGILKLAAEEEDAVMIDDEEPEAPTEPSQEDLLKEFQQMIDQHGGLQAVMNELKRRLDSPDEHPGFIMSVDPDNPDGRMHIQPDEPIGGEEDNAEEGEMDLPEYQPGLLDLNDPNRIAPPSQRIEEDMDHKLKDFFKNPNLDLYNQIVEDLHGYLKSHEEGKTPKEAAEGGVLASTEVLLKRLAYMANTLDEAGAVEEANMIDQFLEKHAEDFRDTQEEADTEQSKRYDAKHHHEQQVREPKTDKERVDREGYKEHHVETQKSAKASASLSTRYCPDHVGVTMGRVGESTYQCPLDGQTYNWETGWTDYEGNENPGGSVAAQTPDSSGYITPHRIFDSRENILNRVN